MRSLQPIQTLPTGPVWIYIYSTFTTPHLFSCTQLQFTLRTSEKKKHSLNGFFSPFFFLLNLSNEFGSQKLVVAHSSKCLACQSRFACGYNGWFLSASRWFTAKKGCAGNILFSIYLKKSFFRLSFGSASTINSSAQWLMLTRNAISRCCVDFVR